MRTPLTRSVASALAGTLAAGTLLLTGGSAQAVTAEPTTSSTALVTSVDSRQADATSARAVSNDTPPQGFTSRFEKVNGFKMHYLRGGEGSPVVLLHGFPQTWAEWRPQMKALAKDHDVIAVDLRGTGDSGVTKKGYDTVQLAKDVRALLVELGVNDGVQVVAHDIGAWVAYPYAALWPDEVQRVVVMEGPIPDERIYGFPALAAPGGVSIWHFGFFQEKLAETLIKGNELAMVKTFITQYLTVDKAFSRADFEFYADYLREPGRLKAWLEMYRELHTDVEQNARFLARGPVTAPVLAIGGEDALGSLVGDQWEEYATDVETRVLADTGHWVTEERPKLLNKLLLDFLQ